MSKEDVEDIRFERVHRIPARKKNQRSTKPRPVMVTFSCNQDKEFIWSYVKNLKGTGIGLSQDYPWKVVPRFEKRVATKTISLF